METRMGCLSVLLAILALAAGYFWASPVAQAPVPQVEPAIPAGSATP